MRKRRRLAMKVVLLLLLSTATACAQSNATTPWSSGVSSIAVATTCDSDDCTPRDLVVRSQDGKTVLLRRVLGCEAVVSRLRKSSDVAAAECFK